MTASNIDLIAAIVSISVVVPLALKGGLMCNIFLIGSIVAKRRQEIPSNARASMTSDLPTLEGA